MSEKLEMQAVVGWSRFVDGASCDEDSVDVLVIPPGPCNMCLN